MSRPPTARRAPTERARCGICGAPLRRADRFCGACGNPAGGPTPATGGLTTPIGGGAALQIDPATQADLREMRRLVTVLFADLSGSTALAERLDPEDLRSILSAYFGVLARQIQRYGGTVDKYIGDAVMAVFGAPTGHEDDAERAISAALDMQQSIAHLNDDLERRYAIRLALRIGINTGEVVAGLLGGAAQPSYTVVGDTVNTAQRFETAAPPGGILVSETTRRLTAHAFAFAPLAALRLKGKAEPQLAFRVVRRHMDDADRPTTPLVGRDAELDALVAAVTAGLGGEMGLILLSGEAGSGKSRLLAALHETLRQQAAYVRVRCASFEDHSPYALVGRLLRGLLRIPPGADASMAEALIVASFEVLGQEIDASTIALLLDVLRSGERVSFDPEIARRVLASVLSLLVRDACGRAPLVLAAEDLQWADLASLGLLADLAGSLADLPCALIVTARPDWQARWPVHEIALEPLDREAARALIDARFGERLEADLAETILQRTSGNPLFIEEIVRDLRDRGVISRRDGRLTIDDGHAARVPATIHELLEARLDRLPPGPRGTLEPAAVCGRTFWAAVLERVEPRSTLGDDLATLEREQLVVQRAAAPDAVYAFRHTLIQEVAYATQLQTRRRALHGAVAEALEVTHADRLDEVIDLLAYHYAHSDNTHRAAHYLVLAADRARRLFANEDAARLYTQASQLVGIDDDLRRAAVEGLGDVLGPLGNLDGARAAYADALALATAAVDQARVQRKLAMVDVRAGDYVNSLAWLDRALATVSGMFANVADAEVAAIWLDRTQVAWRQGRYEEAIAAGQQAAQLAARGQWIGGMAEAFKHLGTTLVLKGDRTAGAEHYRRALDLYEQLNDVPGLMNVHNNLGIVYRRDAQWADALTEQQHALELAQRVSDAWSVGMVLANIAETRRSQGDLAAALATNADALRVWTQANYAVGVATVNMNIGIVNLEAGRLDAARAALELSLDQWQRLDSRLFLPELYRSLALVDMHVDARRALAWAERSLEVAREIAAADEEGAALRVVGQVRARLGQHAEARATLSTAITLLRSTSSQVELARALCGLAETLLDGQSPASAAADDARVRALAREAADLFAAAGAVQAAARARSLIDPAARGQPVLEHGLDI